MADKTEERRRRLFIKNAHAVAKVWPGHALPRPEPKTETDRYMQEMLAKSLEVLVAVWGWCRMGAGSDELFEAAVEQWWVRRLQAAEIFGEDKHGKQIQNHQAGR